MSSNDEMVQGDVKGFGDAGEHVDGRGDAGVFGLFAMKRGVRRADR
jgi:hypothetical protein